jgi:predicted enzyme related to lactoylglutathione lyase
MSGNPVAWFEITGPNAGRLQDYYGALFGWSMEVMDGYGVVAPAEQGIGGGIGPSQDGGSGLVTVYVEVDDVAASLARAEELGGTVVAPPADVPGMNLTIAFFADPDGHVVGLSRGATAS